MCSTCKSGPASRQPLRFARGHHTAAASAAIFVHDPAETPEVPGETLRALFDLTGAERFNTAIATVRTHMRRLFEKTGTTRQPELVRKVLRMNPPLAR